MSVRFVVRLTPRGGRDTIDGVDDGGRLAARVSAPPVDGAANEALIRLLAAELDVPRNAVSIDTGTASRQKRVRIEGTTMEALITRWPGLKTIHTPDR